uniref:Uncharacterized protein n=1 Tax=Lepeophtheirus salmonis TaxID=72036 RepID=A0A0K2VL79_LEPSM
MSLNQSESNILRHQRLSDFLHQGDNDFDAKEISCQRLTLLPGLTMIHAGGGSIKQGIFQHSFIQIKPFFK